MESLFIPEYKNDLVTIKEGYYKINETVNLLRNLADAIRYISDMMEE